ncbi:hypothetical protein QYF36_026408 [Acer negundo]|nr:hypothetical protein QYF36_026408 [Acer negundo]
MGKAKEIGQLCFSWGELKRRGPSYLMIYSVEKMLERWKNHQGKEIDVSEEFRLLTSEVISRTAFGSSYLEGKKRISIEDLVDECKTFYIAGQETSNTMFG